VTTCLFCEREADSAEHLFPDWLNEVLPNIQPTTFVLGGPGGFRGWKSDKPATQKLRVVCKSCNNEWMSGIEGEAKPLLIPMINGQKCRLDIDQQQIVASWAFSRTVIGEWLNPGSAAIPTDHRHWLREHLEPPPQVKVFIAATDARWPVGETITGNTHFSDTKMTVDRDQTDISPVLSKGAVVGYSATILIRHLALQIVANIVDDATFTHDAAFDPYIAQIWRPTKVQQKWPPGPVLAPPVVEGLLEAFRGVRAPEGRFPSEATVKEVATRPNRKTRRAAQSGKKRP
jgi:hypothetical protein